jgi:hypothetical protein
MEKINCIIRLSTNRTTHLFDQNEMENKRIRLNIVKPPLAREKNRAGGHRPHDR